MNRRQNCSPRVPVVGRCVIAVLMLLGSFAFAAIESQSFESESMRERYQGLIHELRCPKCQNQNLSGSDSQIAQDLRNEVARLIREGNSDDEVRTYMVNRYGDFVLYMPPVQDNTLPLWLGPIVMLVLGLGVFLVIVIRLRKQISADKNQEET